MRGFVLAVDHAPSKDFSTSGESLGTQHHADGKMQAVFIFSIQSAQELHAGARRSPLPPAQSSLRPDTEELKATRVPEQLEIITYNQRTCRKAAEQQGEVFCLAGL